ncbi:MAG: hypothetical protein DRJ38_03760 [Thermoprotei archaeon]|nr:MAG: hypothetical protein DRJ38_03760 [Thermoprotei archaeon]
MFKPRTLHFGPAGIPLSLKKRSTVEGIKKVRELGLNAMELEFVRSINISENKAPEVKKVSKEYGVLLTCHGQYYINLNSKDEAKVQASVERILKAAKIAYLSGAWSLTFHAAYYMNDEPQVVYERIKNHLKHIVKELEDQGIEIWIRPETTGKPTQFGTLQELIKLSQEVEYVLPTIDFAHLHAREGGGYNSYEEFVDVLAKLEEGLGRLVLNNMHIHVSGIEYGPKGETRHVNLKESDFNYKDLLKALRDFKVKGVIICESPNLEEDAMLLKHTYLRLRSTKRR